MEVFVLKGVSLYRRSGSISGDAKRSGDPFQVSASHAFLSAHPTDQSHGPLRHVELHLTYFYSPTVDAKASDPLLKKSITREK